MWICKFFQKVAGAETDEFMISFEVACDIIKGIL